MCCALLIFGEIREYRAEAGLRFVKNLGAGINLGNSLDVVGLMERGKNATIEEYALYWGNPPITRELMNEIAKKGFRTVRVPVSWAEHMDADGNVDPEWMTRVTQVVDWGLDAGLYVIIDLHHEKWLVPTTGEEERVTRIFCNLWEQIAVQFQDRGEKLIFEAMNEPRLEDSEEEWTAGTPEMQQVVNRMNRAFIDTVRNTGGENQSRWLIIPAYCSSSQTEALQALEIPEDEHIIVGVHAYLPYYFTLAEDGRELWSEENVEDTNEIDTLMKELEQLFVKKNIPVVITEFGCHAKPDEQQRYNWANYYLDAAGEIGVPCIWWDNGKDSQLIHREQFIWFHEELVNLLLDKQEFQ